MPQYGPFVRGSTVEFIIQFRDADGDLVSPPSAEIHINFQSTNGLRGDRMAALVQDANSWVYNWDSMEAEPGIVHAYAHTPKDEIPVSSIDIRFELLANKANRVAKIVDNPSVYAQATGMAAGAGT